VPATHSSASQPDYTVDRGHGRRRADVEIREVIQAERELRRHVRFTRDVNPIAVAPTRDLELLGECRDVTTNKGDSQIEAITFN
jgi:hypothetical protein